MMSKGVLLTVQDGTKKEKMLQIRRHKANEELVKKFYNEGNEMKE